MDYSQDITASPTFCPAPWTSLNINQLGMVMPCMHSGYLLGNIKQKLIADILQDRPIQSMKKAQRCGQWHEACKECESREQYGTSPRQTWNTTPEVLAQIRQQIDCFFHIEHLTVNWSNLCNLACTYCNAETSTVWQSTLGIPVTYVKNEHDSLIELIVAHGSGLRGLSLGGGEPLLQKGLPHMLEKINPDQVSVMVTTNLSVDLSTNRVYQILKDWPNVDWMISFDNVDKARFEYVRHGANWESFCKNIELMKHNGQRVTAHPAYSIYCALDLDSLYQFCSDRELTLFWCDLSHPVALDIRRQNQQLRDRAIQEIDLCKDRWYTKISGSFDTLERYRQQLMIDPAQLIYMQPQDLDLKLFSARIEQQLHKNHRFQDLWPHIWQLL